MSIAGTSPDRVAALRGNLKVGRIFGLLAKVRSGEASAEERAEFDELTKQARELDPNVLTEDMSGTTAPRGE